MAVIVVTLVVVAFQAGVAVGSANVRDAQSSGTRVSSPSDAVSDPSRAPRSRVVPRETPSPISAGPLGCRFGDLLARPAPDTAWAAIVLDPELGLDQSYVPPDLVDTSEAGLNGGHLVRAIMIRDLRALARAARTAGAALAIQSSYRSFDEQRMTFEYWVATVGRREAITRSARPGHSEHQLGTALDFRSAERSAAPWVVDRDWSRTNAGAWLAVHAWRYGFAMSYPRGARSVSCYGYEPWHYRYFGRRVSAAIHASGQPPRQWLLLANTAGGRLRESRPR
jgi:D-alanyl-D-alanine carboxypeptidase